MIPKKARIDKAALPIGITAKVKDRRIPGMSAKHLAFIRGLPCVVCVAGATLAQKQNMPRGGQAHHLCSVRNRRGMGIKELDMYTLPLCPEHHTGKDGVHSVGSKREALWFANRSVPDIISLCGQFCKVSPDLEIRKVWKEMGA